MGGSSISALPRGDVAATSVSASAAGVYRPGMYPPAVDPSFGGGMAPGMPGMAGLANAAHTAAIQKDIVACSSPPHFVRASVSKFPNSVTCKQKCPIPLGIVIQPLAPLPPDVEEVP